jgi:hypothetical protein
MLGRLLLRKGATEDELRGLLARVEECGSAYLPQVNAFYVREFQMMHAAEDVARFLHQACQGLPHRLNGHSPNAGQDVPASRADDLYARVVEHAVAYFGSRVLYPSRPAAWDGDASQISRAAFHKAAQAALRTDAETIESFAQEWGYRLGTQIYDAYLAGKVASSGLRRLFLAHLDEPGLARKVCAAVISKLRRTQTV